VIPNVPPLTDSRRLCPRCSHLFDEESLIKVSPDEDTVERKYIIGPDTSHIGPAAASGCVFCTMIWKKIGFALAMITQHSRPVVASVRKESVHFFIDCISDTIDLFTLGLTWLENPSEEEQIRVDRTHTFLDPLRNRDGRYSFLDSTNTGGRAVLGLAKAWYQDCLESHPACKALGDFEEPRAQWNPTRLLNIGTSLHKDELRLVESSSMAGPVQYTALSHCWGKNHHLRLLESNMIEFMARVDPGTLSKTFSNAIEVTRLLGIKYIWIDSICIIQDSRQDWEAESAQMGRVYRHSECCIAATAAPDGSFGCFVERDPRTIEPLKVPRAQPFKIEKFQDSSESQQTGPGYYEVVNRDLWLDEIEGGALTYRGWAFQERILSQRILHFGKSQIFWECRQRNACESYPAGLPVYMSMPWREELVPRTERPGRGPAYLAPDDEQTPRAHAYKFWQNILESYAPRLLTMEDDKLPAVSGVAKYVQQAAKDQYFAGLWGSNMARDLLWRLENRRAPPADWRAPTWSWASRNGGLNLWRNYSFKAWSDMPDEPEKEELMVVLGASITPTSQDTTAQVSEGHIILHGQLAPALIKSNKREVDAGGAILWSDNMLQVFVGEGKLKEVSDAFNCFPDEPVEDEEVLVYCLPVIDLGAAGMFMTGLMLKPYDEIEFPGVFYRFGIFQTFGGDRNKSFWASTTWWQTQTDKFGQPYIEQDGFRTFLIYLV